ncbi:MAG TPA: PIG-L deacetylase family protein [Thermoanaerobaculia bacterium]|nr:PIG-L deacetylase family protein [Thermoanaerobaculia bacterium]
MSLLFVGAHPDDELYAAGLLAALAERGIETHLLCLTRGEGGTTGGIATRENLGQVREQELRASAAALGIATVELMGYVDPFPDGRARPPEVAPQVLVREIEKRKTEALLTHGSNGEYGHPAHRLIHEAARLVQGVALYTFNAAAPGISIWGGENVDDPADLVLDVTPWLEAKTRAFAAHATQREVWRRIGDPSPYETFRRWGTEDPLRSWLGVGAGLAPAREGASPSPTSKAVRPKGIE